MEQVPGRLRSRGRWWGRKGRRNVQMFSNQGGRNQARQLGGRATGSDPIAETALQCVRVVERKKVEVGKVGPR